MHTFTFLRVSVKIANFQNASVFDFKENISP